MARFARLRLSLLLPALVLLVCCLPGRCFADYALGDISRKRADELGITVSTQSSANQDVRVMIEFKTEGALKEFRWAELELTQGGKRLLATDLLPKKPAANSPADAKLLEFYIDPIALSNAAVTIFTGSGFVNGEGYRLHLKDYPVPRAFRQ